MTLALPSPLERNPIMKRLMQFGLAALSILAFSTTPGRSQETSASVADESSQSPPPGEVNREVSRVYTFVDKTGFGHQHAIEGRLQSGHLTLGASTDAGELIFDMQSFEADTDKARRYLRLSGTTDTATRAKVNKNMKSPEVLNVANYPTATFMVDSTLPIQQTAGDGLPVYELVGRFILCGKARPIKVLAAVEQARGWLHVRGKFGIKQTEFGITPYSTALGAVGVADSLVIHGDLYIAPTPSIDMTAFPTRE